MFDGDYLNQVNSKRLDDLKQIDHRYEIEKDKLTDYLERESSAAKIRLHEENVKTELMNEDILKNDEYLYSNDYEAPLRVVDKYGDLPTLDQLSSQSQMMKTPISHKLILKSYQTKSTSQLL